MVPENAHYQQHGCGYFPFKSLLRCSDDSSLPLVEKIRNSMGFWATNRLRVDKVWTAGCFSVQPLLRIIVSEWQGSHNNSQTKTTKSINSHHKTQEYIKNSRLLTMCLKSSNFVALSLRSKHFRLVSEQRKTEDKQEPKNERRGRGRRRKETLADRPLDFENLRSLVNAAPDWLG